MTTALVMLAMMAAAGLLLWSRYRPDRPWDGEVVQTELRQTWQHWGAWGGNAVLATLPEPAAMNGNGLRLVIMPSFSDWYGLALYRDGHGRGTMLLTRLQQPTADSTDAMAPIQIAAMTAMSRDYDEQLAWFDSWVERHGRTGLQPCMDGTPTAFERIMGNEVTSGMGNCETPYDLLKQRMLALAKRHFPQAPLPADPDWHDMR